MSSNAFAGRLEPVGGFEAARLSRRANRRRLLVFAGVALATAIVGLVYVFARPPVYEAASRLDFAVADDDPARGGTASFGLRDEVQYLTSRTLLAKVWNGLAGEPTTPAALHGGDPPATLQAMLDARPVDGTHVVVVRARGADAAFLPRLVDRVVAEYRAGLGDRYRTGSTVTATDAADEARRLAASVADLRRDADAFRARYGIVSAERDGNQVLSGARSLGAALDAANAKVVAAEARLATLTDAEAAGRSGARARDNPTLAGLEQEAARIRADLQETARTFTPAYMDIDPRIRSLRARLADVEQQASVQRRTEQQTALQEARDELNTAQATAAALRRQLATDRDATQAFASRLDEYRAMQEQVTRVDALHQKAVERVARLQAEQQSRLPKVSVLEPAATPQAPSGPPYGRDAGIALAAAVVAGLLAMAIVELFNRPAPTPSTVIVPQAWLPAGAGATMALPALAADDAFVRLAAPGSEPRRLQAPSPLPRELNDAEIDALLAAADPQARPAIALLLLGLTPAEVVALGRADLRDDAVVVAGVDARTVPLPARVRSWLDDGAAATAPGHVVSAGGRPLSEADLATALLYAAHDAAIEGADAVTPDALRHTAIAHLLRHGLRLADIARRVGALPPDRLADYRRLMRPTPDAAPTDADLALPSLAREPG